MKRSGVGTIRERRSAAPRHGRAAGLLAAGLCVVSLALAGCGSQPAAAASASQAKTSSGSQSASAATKTSAHAHARGAKGRIASGTITAVTDVSMTLHLTAGGTQLVSLLPAARVLEGKAGVKPTPTSVRALAAGQRVRVREKTTASGISAAMVRIILP